LITSPEVNELGRFNVYSRNISIKLKPNPFSLSEFTEILESDIIPLLRRQKGFQDEISFIAPERNEAVAVSFWDKKENADAYQREKYPEVLRALSRVVEGTPRVDTFEVASSTFRRITVSAEIS
jgi:heme-degrading monooxygenase HmoA